jgi:hypothetical protein
LSIPPGAALEYVERGSVVVFFVDQGHDGSS